YKDWIFLPSSVTFETSTDGKNFTAIQTINNNISPDEKEPFIKDFAITFPEQKVRYIKVTAKNTVCPKGHPGEGKPAWIFADEIVVN
ncbi:MAG: beta-N-acetylhexosaminidase, partial [Parafilimonas sp.]